MKPLQRRAELDGRTLLVCVGAMKAATSWLFAQLQTTPGVAVSPLKEVHFFDARFPVDAIMDTDELAMRRLAFHLDQPGDPVENLRRRPAFRASLDRVAMILDDEAYFDHFARLARPGDRVLADITPAYAVIGREGFAYMRRLCVERGLRLKVLFVMRDPVDRLWSHMRFLPQLDRETDPLRDWPALLRDPRVMARSDYRRTLDDLDATFAPGEVLHLFYETLPTAGVAALHAELGLGPPVVEAGARYNETTLKAALPDDAAEAFAAALADQYAACRERFGDGLPPGWSRRRGG